MAATEAVTIQAQPNARPRQVRISSRVRCAVDAMVDKARKRAEAAQEAGLTDDALYRALTKPEVQAYRYTRMKVLRESEASRTIARAAVLADDAESEHVRLQANTWLASIDGVSPVSKSEITHTHQGSIPGLTIIFGGTDPGLLIAHQPREIEDGNTINALPRSVPHPAMRNATETQAIAAPDGRAKPRWRKMGGVGEK